MFRIEACFAKDFGAGIFWIFPAPMRDKFGETLEILRFESHCLTGVANSGPAAIGDDVSGHGGAALAVAFVNILNRALALVTAGEIEVNVRPFAAFFRQKPLKQ